MNVAIFGIMIAAIFFITARIPTGLVPNDIKGMILRIVFLLNMILSLNRTQKVNPESVTLPLPIPDVIRVGAMSGLDFIIDAYKTGRGISFIRLRLLGWRHVPIKPHGWVNVWVGFLKTKSVNADCRYASAYHGYEYLGGFECTFE